MCNLQPNVIKNVFLLSCLNNKELQILSEDAINVSVRGAAKQQRRRGDFYFIQLFLH